MQGDHLTVIAKIVPLLSQSSHPLPANLTEDDIKALTNRVQYGGDEVVKAKDGAGSATLSMAYAGAEFAAKLLRAIKGEKGVVAPTFVHLSADEGGKTVQEEIGAPLDFFSSRVELGVSDSLQMKRTRSLSTSEHRLMASKRFFRSGRSRAMRRPFWRPLFRSSRSILRRYALVHLAAFRPLMLVPCLSRVSLSCKLLSSRDKFQELSI